MKWVFDIDGVVANTFPILSAKIEKEYKVCWYPYMPYFPVKICSNIKNKKFYNILNTLIKEGIKPVSGAVETINEYQKQGNPIVFITNRDVNLYKPTEKFLNTYFNFKHKLFIGSKMNKKDIAKEYNIKGIIDDKVKICREFIENGLNAICHKQGHQYWEDTDGLKVLDWQEIRDIIL